MHTVFAVGLPSLDPTNPDYIPNLLLGYNTRLAEAETRQSRHQRCKQRAAAADERHALSTAARTLLDLSQSDNTNYVSEQDLLMQTLEAKDETINSLQQEVASLRDMVASLQQEIEDLKAKLQEAEQRAPKTMETLSVDFIAAKDSDFRTKFFTGLPNFQSFLWLVNLCAFVLPTSKTLPVRDVLLLILMKLNLNLKHQDLAWRFNISSSQVSKLLNKGLPAIAEQLKFMIRWPDKADVVRTMPIKFRRLYPNCRVIVDCTEIY